MSPGRTNAACAPPPTSGGGARCGAPLRVEIRVLLGQDGAAVSCVRSPRTGVVVSVTGYSTISEVDGALAAAGAGGAEGHHAELDAAWLLSRSGLGRLRCGGCDGFHGIEIMGALLDESGEWCGALLEWATLRREVEE
jgi:hypothetical protein